MSTDVAFLEVIYVDKRSSPDVINVYRCSCLAVIDARKCRFTVLVSVHRCHFLGNFGRHMSSINISLR